MSASPNAAQVHRAHATGRVLLVEDDPDQAAVFEACLRREPYALEVVSSGEAALERHARAPADVLVTDLHLPAMSGLDLIRRLAEASARGSVMPLVVVITGAASVATAVEALQRGAADYLQKPVDPARLISLVGELLRTRAAREAETDAADQAGFEGMLGASAAMRAVFGRITRVASTMAPVLIVGESGTGKELVARAVHARSRRARGPFVPVHTGAIPRELIASELFGHEKGSFTGAFQAAEGKFEAAATGTVFLDEVGTMDPAVQVSLLRVLESYRFTRVGGRGEIHADVRIVAATNKDLLDLVDERLFREDLYYRLNVFTVTLPPLRDRAEDIGPIARRFLVRSAERYGTPARDLSAAALERLSSHRWPGNVRELRNAMEETALFAPARLVTVDDLQLDQGRMPQRPRAPSRPAATAPPELPVPRAPALPPDAALLLAAPATEPVTGGAVLEEPPPGATEPVVATPPPAAAAELHPERAEERAEHSMVLRVAVGTRLADVERQLIRMTLASLGGNKQRAARVLGISRRGLYSKLQAFGVQFPEAEAPAEVAEPGSTSEERSAAERV